MSYLNEIHRTADTSSSPPRVGGRGQEDLEDFAGHVSGPDTGPIQLDYAESFRLLSDDFRKDPAFLAWCKSHAEGLTGSTGSALSLILSEELRSDLRVATAFRGGRAYQAQHPDETDDYPGGTEG